MLNSIRHANVLFTGGSSRMLSGAVYVHATIRIICKSIVFTLVRPSKVNGIDVSLVNRLHSTHVRIGSMWYCSEDTGDFNPVSWSHL